jgi:4-hydroxythreonine-4-phosphate dehydrogenase
VIPRPVIAVTLGDPAGIGPEITDAALASPELPGDFDFEVLGRFQTTPGHPTQEGARAALEALERAAKGALEGRYAAVVTGPIHKTRMQEVGFRFPGQTEFFAKRWNAPNHAMLLTGGQLTVALVTAHLPLAEVPRRLSIAEIVRVGSLLADFLRSRGHPRPRLAVAGLNPHAGENGLLGREDLELIQPAAHQLAQRLEAKAEVSGPWAPDAVFREAIEGRFDGVLCMYHDQGLIPLKLHAFDSGVNVTLGLPFPRTSPDHGTAFEIAGKNIARSSSMQAALQLATSLVRSRLQDPK